MIIVLGAIIVFSLNQSIVHLSPAFIALAVVGGALLWVHPKDVSKIFEHIQWVTLIFFVALFVIVIEAVPFLMSDVVRWPMSKEERSELSMGRLIHIKSRASYVM